MCWNPAGYYLNTKMLGTWSALGLFNNIFLEIAPYLHINSSLLILSLVFGHFPSSLLKRNAFSQKQEHPDIARNFMITFGFLCSHPEFQRELIGLSKK